MIDPTRTLVPTSADTYDDTPVPGDLRPIVAGFYPDPTICRVGPDYYLAQSSFEFFPGVPLWHSRDLLTWTQIGHIFTRRSQFARGDGRPSSGLYAGTLRHHGGEFYYVTTNVSDYDAGQLLVRAQDPAGPWSDPVRIPDAIGIDPDLAWDDDGTCFLTWKAMDFVVGEIGILQARLDPITGRLFDEPYPVWQGSGLGAAESPHLYQVGSTWYLMLAEGGTERGHAVTVARGPHPSGPFQSCPANPILSHRSTIHPTQNTGHADLVQTQDGAWAAVYLGVRPRGSTPGFHVNGRETFLAGIDWVDGWPEFDETRYQIPRTDTAFSDDFGEATLHHRWVVPGGEATTSVQHLHPDGGIVVLPHEAAEGGGPASPASGVLCTRVRDLRWHAEATVHGSGSFQLRLDDLHLYALTVDDGAVHATAHVGELTAVLATARVSSAATVLRLEAVAPSTRTVPLGLPGPDDILMSVVHEGETSLLARIDGRYLSTEVASGFTGRMLGLAATANPARVTSVSYRPHPE